jgi:hypothetical protein
MLLKSFVNPIFEEDLSTWIASPAYNKSRNVLIARVDSSKTGKKYGHLIPETKVLYDYVDKKKMKTHEVFVLLISIGKKDYVGGFILCRKDRVDGVNESAKKLLQEFVSGLPLNLQSEFTRHCRIALDGAWGNGTMIAWLSKTGNPNWVVKSGGKDNVRDCHGKVYTLKEFSIARQTECLRLGLFKPLNRTHLEGIEYYTERVQLVSQGYLEIALILVRFPATQDTHKDRYLLLITQPSYYWSPFRAIQTYKGRWQIEVMFRTCKQDYELETYSCHVKTQVYLGDKEIRIQVSEEDLSVRKEQAFSRIERHLAICFIRYMMIQWYRVADTRCKKTPLREVLLDWQTYLDKIPEKAFKRLFAR